MVSGISTALSGYNAAITRLDVSVSNIANQSSTQLDFPHFYPRAGQVITQKISSWAMKRSASSIDRTVRPKGPVDAHRSFQSDQ